MKFNQILSAKENVGAISIAVFSLGFFSNSIKQNFYLNHCFTLQFRNGGGTDIDTKHIRTTTPHEQLLCFYFSCFACYLRFAIHEIDKMVDVLFVCS